MSSYILFLLLGLGSGAVYAVLGLGLVLKYRSAGVVDFAHGAVAMFCAYVYIELRSNGELQFPWILIPHQVRVASSNGMAVLPSILITLVYSAILGLIFYLLVYRPLRRAPALARVGASIGVMLGLQAIAVLNYSTFALSSPPILPDTPLHIAGLFVPSDRLYLAGLTVLVGIVLAAVYRFTRFGLITRAAVENERGAAMLGHSASRIAAYNWVLATVLAAAAGILILPITTLNPGVYTLFIVPALGAALLGRFSSFSVTVIAGLVLGMLQSELTKLQTVWTWLPQQGLQDGLPFVFIMIAMIVLAKRLTARGAITDVHNPAVGRPSRPALTTAASMVIGIIAVVLVSSEYKSAIISSAITACICFSVVVITGYVGQISLAQNALAGISAFMLSHIAQSLGIGFPLGLILAALCSVLVGLVIGLPAVRVRGVNLAVTTLATAAALDALVFNNTWFSGGYVGRHVGGPTLLGLNLAIVGAGRTYPRVAFCIFIVIMVALVGFFVARLRNGRMGRIFLAVRSNERAAASIGVDVARTKLVAFAIAAFIAGIGGGLLAYQEQNINPDAFTLWTSLIILAITYVGGVGRITGAVAAGALLASNGLVPTLLNNVFNFNQYQLVIAGVLLTITAVANPDGMTKEMGAGLTKLRLKIVDAVRGEGQAAAVGVSETPPAPAPKEMVGR
ncbi:MAG TPA: ABC transporter permease [Solirubrobacteraceae bacterium]|nr:ABC transporter permease [Solirubrobacteraceae bacterium]